MVDAFATAVGAVIQQFDEVDWVLLAFLSQKQEPVGTRYSTSGHELLALCVTIKHFRHFLELRDAYFMRPLASQTCICRQL